LRAAKRKIKADVESTKDMNEIERTSRLLELGIERTRLGDTVSYRYLDNGNGEVGPWLLEEDARNENMTLSTRPTKNKK
jgi:hypothetical protein